MQPSQSASPVLNETGQSGTELLFGAQLGPDTSCDVQNNVTSGGNCTTSYHTRSSFAMTWLQNKSSLPVFHNGERVLTSVFTPIRVNFFVNNCTANYRVADQVLSYILSMETIIWNCTMERIRHWEKIPVLSKRVSQGFWETSGHWQNI